MERSGRSGSLRATCFEPATGQTSARFSVKHSFAPAAVALSLWCGAFAAGCAKDRAQQVSDELLYPPKGPDYSCAPEETQLALTDTTLLGVDAETLLSGVLPLETQPLFWVGYDSYFPASYLPGVSTSSVTLEVSARDGEPVVQLVRLESCGELSTVSVPVHVALKSADGALAEELDTALIFSSGSTAALAAFVPAANLVGRFAFTSATQLDGWDFKGLSLGISVWPGGSRGHIAPELYRRGSDVEPDPLPGALTGYVDSLAPAIPDHWNLLAVWPRREACLGAVYDAHDRLAGWSLEQAAQELTSQGAGRLVESDGTSTPIHFTVEPLAGLVCAQADLRVTRDVGFRARGRLKADAGGSASALEQLDASETFVLSASAAIDGEKIQRLHWDRIRSFIPTGQTRVDFVAATGLERAAAPADQLLLWSWEGTSTRSDAGDWATTGQFSVQSAHEVDAKICQAMQEPPPGTRPPPPSCMSFPSAQIDGTLISAVLAR